MMIHIFEFFPKGKKCVVKVFFGKNPFAESENYEIFYHEVTHQLFAESKENNRGGSSGNSWIVEGIASYIETWVKKNGQWIPGGDTKIGMLDYAKKFLKKNTLL